MRTCGMCKVEKTLDLFSNDKNKLLGKSYRCKECTRENSKKWHLENPDYARKYGQRNYLQNKEARLIAAKEYRDSHKEEKRESNRKRKALLKQVQTSKYSEKDVLETYGTVCHICLIEIDMDAPRWTAMQGWQMGLHIDHVMPISKGGADSLENVRPSHAVCNLIKNDNVLE